MACPSAKRSQQREGTEMLLIGLGILTESWVRKSFWKGIGKSNPSVDDLGFLSSVFGWFGWPKGGLLIYVFQTRKL